LKRRGVDINGLILLLAIAFLPNAGAWARVAYVLGVVVILAAFTRVHAQLIPLTEVVLGPAKPNAWKRIGAPTTSWLLALASAVLVKFLADLLSNESALPRLWQWLSGVIGLA
jgi:hypothetical protein